LSRRYGRNQKRAHRQRIAELETALTSDRELLKFMRKRNRELEDVIENASNIAGEMSVLFPAKNIETRQPSMPTWDISIRDETSIFHPMAGAMEKLTFETQRLNVMLGRIGEDPLRRATHFMIKFGDKRWGYALSHEAIHSAPRHILQRMVCENLGKVIGMELKQ
jgi:hypothetical protein